jgi:hypothetical protein
MSAAVRVELPAGLALLAGVRREVVVDLEGPVTQRSILDALEQKFPALEGAIRDRATRQRRPFIRFFACQQDFSHLPADTPLPGAIGEGAELFLIVGAIAGG